MRKRWNMRAWALGALAAVLAGVAACESRGVQASVTPPHDVMLGTVPASAAPWRGNVDLAAEPAFSAGDAPAGAADAGLGMSSRGVSSIVARDGRSLDATSFGAAPGPEAERRLRVKPFDELWIIAREPDRHTAAVDDLPGSGCLVYTPLGGGGVVPVPLEHTDVDAHVSGHVSSVNVKQRFHNPYAEKIEAVYVLPLPDDAAVNGFVMTIGQRTIRGVIREKEQAERIYTQARAAGHAASLLTQQRPNIFTQKVANIEPRQRIDIDITYFHTLPYADGWYEFVFPMVVGPRYNPPHTVAAGDAVLAVPAGQPARGGGAAVQYLRPGERPSTDIAIDVTIDAGVRIEAIECVAHKVDVERRSDNVRTVSLARGEGEIPNRDFVLRYRVAGRDVKSGMLVQQTGTGSYFTMMLVPPDSLNELPRAPVEFVFVVDTSGSMTGEPLEQAKDAIRAALKGLDEDDTFQIVRFSSDASQLGRRPLAATSANLREARRYLDGLTPGGGTEMVRGIEAALRFPRDGNRVRYVTFITDGYIGNEDDVLRAVEEDLGEARVFSFGVGSSVNRHLMERMARVGRGAVAYINPREDAAEVMSLFLDRVSHPAMTDVTIDWGGLRVEDVHPPRVSDLFVGRPVTVTGRIVGDASAALRAPITVNGRTGFGVSEITVGRDAITLGGVEGLDALWARARVRTLSDAARTRDPGGEIAGEILATALRHGLMSNYTAFVAVDSAAVTSGDHGTSVAVPVAMPAGVRYDTTVGGGE